MRVGRIVLIMCLLALPFALTSSAAALDLEVDFQPPPGEAGTPYEFAFVAEEGCLPYRFSFLNGTLPPGLRITVDGKLTGTPTEAGTFSFWVGLNDNAGPDNPYCLIPSVQSQAEFTMVVLPDLAVTTETLPTATPGRPYSFQLQFSNPEVGWPVIWDIVEGALPAGLTLSESGVISGTPGGADTKTFVVRAREPFRRFGQRALTLRVATALQARTSFGPGEVGVGYSASVAGSGGASPLSYAVDGSLPARLTLNTTSGAVTGTPTSAGVFPVRIVVSDAVGQTVTVAASIRVAARLAITTNRLPGARAGAAYATRLRSSGGVAPKRWRIVRGSLPRGVRLAAATGALSGAPRQAGVFRVTFQARDRLGALSTKSLRLVVTG
jgi:hypothetical protein